MRRLIISCSVIILLFSVLTLDAQNLKRNSLITGVCYAGNKVNRIYIPPPAKYFKNKDAKGGAKINVIYSGFTNLTVEPVEKAVAILEALLPPDVTITILANWTTIPITGVLANSSTTGFVTGWGIDAFIPWAIYPVSLAEKIAGKNLNTDTEGDIQLNINSTANWYLGTDGNPSVTQYDLVTVIIHEIIHGLGFFDSMYSDGTLGSYGSYSVPMVYDTFIENLDGQKLIDTNLFKNPSATLKSQITGGLLYFNGPLLNFATGKMAKLWAPSTYDAGSSIAHLDEYAFPAVSGNGLMTPYIDKGEAIHNPGSLTMAILGDLGWINTRISHTPHRDTEDYLSALEIKATVVSDTLFDKDSVGLALSFNNFETSDTLYLTKAEADTFITTIQIPGYNSKLDYYLFVKDCFSRTYRLPSYIDKFKFSVYIGADTVKPVITHAPLEYYMEKFDSLRFEAKVSDNIGIDTVYIEYKVNEGDWNYLGLIPDGNSGFRNALSKNNLSLLGGDSVQYRIIAFDNAAIRNRSTLPGRGYYTINIEKINSVADSYSTNFKNAAADFFNIGFNIIQPTGFTGNALHTRHPYESPEEDGDSIVYTSILRTPVKYDASGMLISFMELVLVEPGEDESLFGSSDFYDYVIVEGSRNFGYSWFRLADGYDSRYVFSWLNAYNSSVTDGNSTYQGKESMLLKHSFTSVASSNISTGDTLMIRFRLFSDPYANGWGWVIDDLQIGPLIDDIADINYQQHIIYPNPGNGLINIRNISNTSGKPVKYNIYNAAGSCIITGFTSGAETDLIDISGFTSGIYFIVLNGDQGIRTLKYSLIK